MASLTIRAVTDIDAPILHSLAQRCAPLDVHTPYTYWVLSHMFGASCFIAFDDKTPVGFITSVHDGAKALLWQVGLLESHRGFGASALLIDAVMESAGRAGLAIVELSIDPNNAASRGAFQAYAVRHGLDFVVSGEVDLHDEHDPSFREYEDLYQLRISPVSDVAGN